MNDQQFNQLLETQYELIEAIKTLSGHLVPKKNKKPVSTTKQVKKQQYGQHKNVLLTSEEFTKLYSTIIGFEELLEVFSDGIAMKDYKYKDHNLAIRKWAKNFTPTETTQLHNPLQ